MRQSRAAGLILILFTSACAVPYDPFRIPATELRGRVRTIALAPLRVEAGIADQAFAREQIEQLVAGRLGAGGFRVVASAEMEQLWRSAAADVGDLFDPTTGEVDQERYDAVEAAVYHELHVQHGADAVIWMRIRAVELYPLKLPGTRTTFCGTTDAVYWPDNETYYFEQIPLVRVSCLSATLYDMEERELYYIRSGLETIETFAQQTRAKRPFEQRLRDPARLQQAVDTTVGPLADRVAGR